MGTRCLTRVFDEQGRELVCMYRHNDGYPEAPGHGHALAEFLAARLVVAGLSTLAIETARARDKILANGMSCLAAQLVAHFKEADKACTFYLYPSGTSDVWERWVYEVRLLPARDAITSELLAPLPGGEVADAAIMAIVYGFLRIRCVEVVHRSSDRQPLTFEGSPAEFLKWLKSQESENATR